MKSFIEKAKEIHGDKYNYSKVNYINNYTNVCIICPEHGEFWQTPKNHLKGCNCPKCSGVYKPTTEEWIAAASKVHNNKYDYSKTVFKSNKEKVCIICPEHGEFWQIPNNHLRGEGCIQCRNDQMARERKLTTEEFIEKAKSVHGEKYDYSKVNYVNNSTDIVIVCPKHGEFIKRPANHLHGQGCPKCKKEEQIRIRREIIFKKVKKVTIPYHVTAMKKVSEKYGDKYILSESDIKNSKNKIKITCPIHGPFYKNLNKFLSGQECELCKSEKRKNEQCEKNKDEFIKTSEIKHNRKYDYSKVKYINNSTNVCIICPIHGEFWQMPSIHKNGCGCPVCAQESRNEKQTKTTEKFVSELINLYGNKFDYSQVNYVNSTTPIKLICHEKKKNGEEHGGFFVSPNKSLFRACNCPTCLNSTSLPEQKLYNFICGLVGSENVIHNDKKVLNRHEIDIYVPSLKIGFEFNGLYWHSEKNDCILPNNHVNKTNKCEEKGIRLIQIFSDEYLNKKEIVESKIKHILGKNDNLEKIMARKCTISEIDKNTAKSFLNKFHLQGFVGASVYLGAFYNGTIVAVMSFKKEQNNNKWELNRFATDINIVCPGIGGKMFKNFLNIYNPSEVKSFADRRWSTMIKENLYEKIGFKLTKIIPRDYKYVSGKKPSQGRIHKFNFRKQVLHKKYGFPLSMTEREMAQKIGFYRVYDCGLLKYVWKKENKI